MLQHPIHKRTFKRSFLGIVSIYLAIFSLAACGSNEGNGSGQTPSPTPIPFQVTSVDLSVLPSSIAGTVCGSSASFTYLATFHIPANTAGGTIQFSYTLNNGRSQTNASVTSSP